MRVLWTLHRDGVMAQAFLEDLGDPGVELIIMTSDSTPPRSDRFTNASLAREWATLERARLIQEDWHDCPA